MHQEALDYLIGPSSDLWSERPELACVLLATVPSGDVELVQLRSELTSRLRMPRSSVSRSLRPAVIHGDRPVGQDASRLIYVGCGRNDPQGRPSPYYNPFFDLDQSEAVANYHFEQWLSVRMDPTFFLPPLLGKSLLCDCHRGLGCHVHTLLRFMDTVFPPPGICERHFGFVTHPDTVPTLSPSARVLPLDDVRRECCMGSDARCARCIARTGGAARTPPSSGCVHKPRPYS